MKILIYEPGTGGHRETILKYVERILNRNRIQFIVIRVPLKDSEIGELNALRKIASQENCDLVHILTIDGRALGWLRKMYPARTSLIPVVGTYYLYSNLWARPRSILWDYFLLSRKIDLLLISDDFWNDRLIPPWRAPFVKYLPDPWDPLEFPAYSRSDACDRLRLNPAKCRILLFGDLSTRKGVISTLQAAVHAVCADFELLIVGTLNKDVGLKTFNALVMKLNGKERIRLVSGYVDELDVSLYFHASDYVLCSYSPDFLVSSGTFTRACASNRPVIATSHGVIGRLVRETGCGIIFDFEVPHAKTTAIEDAVDAWGSEKYTRMQRPLRNISESRTLDRYAEYLMAAYYTVLPTEVVPDNLVI